MIRDDPGLDPYDITSCLWINYAISVASLRFLPIGYDLSAFVYEVIAKDGRASFLKVRTGSWDETVLRVPRELVDYGIPNILAPLRTHTSALWCPLEDNSRYTAVLYPFIRGDNAMVTGLTDDQWRKFGKTLRAVHDSGLHERFRDGLRTEGFDLPSAALVRQMQNVAAHGMWESPAAMRFATFWRENADRIGIMLQRAEELGRSLQTRSFERVLCHTDIHAANILVGENRHIWLVDWDGPMIAPRERDLLFVIGSRIASEVAPNDERHFFEGYGSIEIEPEALIYYRYERIIEDIGEIAKSVFKNPDASEEAKQGEVELAMGFFAPDGNVDRAESVTPHW